jgi:ribosomal protein S3
LENVGCDHAKAIVRPEIVISADDIKNSSTEASSLSGKFYSEVWIKGGHEIADEAIRKNEKESHDTQEEAKRAEEATERSKLIVTLTED